MSTEPDVRESAERPGGALHFTAEPSAPAGPAGLLPGASSVGESEVGGLDDDELPPGERASTLFLVIVAGLSAVADLATKAWAQAQLAGADGRRPVGKSITVIENYVDFIFAQNPGGAWSFARSLPEGLRRPFFLFVSAAAIVFILAIYRRVHRSQTAMKWGLPLALGGAIGNLVDRMRFGWVIDFIDVYVSRGGREHHWPTFNVADVAIVVGVVLMGLNMFTATRRARAEEAAAQPVLAPEPALEGAAGQGSPSPAVVSTERASGTVEREAPPEPPAAA
ncbi:signal peptidase II [Chondromyces crocatus]|uniref:Lipoprotein signal peptidase n=1 Tax=Chondromyces crocatus TaxID=52 RepID=A0A0K1EJ76_CHOCO|nr:signal peptidase II [Chondromyces crocatus]AKT40926.1 uncharacterized protein CMC5_050830 [Chondromyces crocatus]